MTNTVKKTFKLHPDQMEIVEAALSYAKAKSGTKSDTVALEYICQEVMGTGLSFETLEAAMTAEYKKSTDAQEFITKVLTLVKKISGLNITVTIEEPCPKAP